MGVPAAIRADGLEQQMNRFAALAKRLVDWLTETLERAQARDRDRYVAQSSNPREVSQRIHRLERGSEALHG